MKFLILGAAALIAASCAHDQQSPSWDSIQREEEVQKEESSRTTNSDEVGPSYDQNGRLSSPAPVD